MWNELRIDVGLMLRRWATKLALDERYHALCSHCEGSGKLMLFKPYATRKCVWCYGRGKVCLNDY